MAAKKKKASSEGAIQLTRLQDVTIEIPIVGITPIIPHKWSEKAKAMMPGHPDADTVKTKKGKRDPELEAESHTYRLPDGRPGIPATAFKAAITTACRFFDKPSMEACKQLIFVEGEGPDELVPIECEVELFEATPRNSNRSADLRYRNKLCNWRATLRVRYPAGCITASSVVTLTDAAGRGGVGDWRPTSPKSFTGTFGTWRVDVDEEEIEE